MYKIAIETATNGYIVQVGCQRLVFQKRKALVRELNRYLKDPDGVEHEYRNKYGHRHTGSEEAAANVVDQSVPSPGRDAIERLREATTESVAPDRPAPIEERQAHLPPN